MSNYAKAQARSLAAVSAALGIALMSGGVNAGARDSDDAYEDDGYHSRHPYYWDHKRRRRSKVIHGITVTGVNNVLGKPAFSWGDPYGPFGFPTLGAYNENGTTALPLTETSPSSTILATVVDPNLLVVSGATPEDVKPEWLNVPLRDIPVNVDFNFVNKAPLPPVMQSIPLRPGQAEPVDGPITLGQWMKAAGVVKIVCSGGRASVDLYLSRLIPRRMYTVWGTFGLPRDGSATTFFPLPLGGTPNVVIAGEHGNARFKRSLNFCPFDPDSTDRPLLTINVQFHGNSSNYGGVPEPGFIHGYWQGLVTFTQIQFPINVERLD
jgi:hypothetical protein